jgi:carbamoyltransferase
MSELIAGFHSGHDCSFGVLKDGVPVVHAELERYIRLKEPIGDSLEFLFEKYAEANNIKYFTTGIDLWHGGPRERFPKTWGKAQKIAEANGGKFQIVGHHQSHAANAFFSSNLDEALIITVDGGGEEIDDDQRIVNANFTVWIGKGNKIERLAVLSEDGINKSTNIGGFWSRCTKQIFDLSDGYPYGHQAGSVMAMAAIGDHQKYYDDFYRHLNTFNISTSFNYKKYKKLADSSEQERYDIAASLQRATEDRLKNLIGYYLSQTGATKLCISGGVSLNCVFAGKLYGWFENQVDEIYADPIPYDAGLTLGSARYLWHHILDNPRIKWEDNSSSYLGFEYPCDLVTDTLSKFESQIECINVDDDFVVDLLINKKIVSVYGGGSESGRRALGNRSILADPRHADTKDIVNERVKHRQWYRPFAPSVLREHVAEWFVRDIDSPYMSFAISFKKEKQKEVPAVAHFDGTARLQTVTKNDNEWYYNFISNFYQKTGVPILLNTSFNDREPIVEFPEHAIKCFLGTEIDYLYFYELGILVRRAQT